jgi:predicted RNA binding protein YcfA (HicA-like mRNA interferase family)
MPLSGKAMVQLYQNAGWRVVGQRGSHVKLRSGHQTEIIPLHKELKKGMEAKLLKRLAGDSL